MIFLIFFFNGELCCGLESELFTKNKNKTPEIPEAMRFTSQPWNTGKVYVQAVFYLTQV